jgi:hypothetical protein
LGRENKFSTLNDAIRTIVNPQIDAGRGFETYSSVFNVLSNLRTMRSDALDTAGGARRHRFHFYRYLNALGVPKPVYLPVGLRC